MNITPEAVEKVITKERDLGNPIDALLPTLGGQTALNCACQLADAGTLDKLGVEMIGANREVIHRAEDRKRLTPQSRTNSRWVCIASSPVFRSDDRTSRVDAHIFGKRAAAASRLQRRQVWQ